MKTSSFLKVAVLAMPLLLGSCKSKKAVETETKAPTAEEVNQENFLQKVKTNSQTARFVTSKVKFTVEVGQQSLGLTGNLKMKRDDVIRLQLMAFGFVEAGRIEFTKDYVLIMDRINKLYLKAPYIQVDFLRNSGLNFYSLQALFWNELFMPNRTELKAEDMSKFHTMTNGDDVIISLDDNKLSYSWLANANSGVIRMANILYKEKFSGNSQLNWDYQEFTMLGSKKFPKNMGIVLTTPEKEVKLGMTLNYLGNETEWETRTEVSNKYREVTIDEILRRFMSL